MTRALQKMIYMWWTDEQIGKYQARTWRQVLGRVVLFVEEKKNYFDMGSGSFVYFIYGTTQTKMRDTATPPNTHDQT